MDGIILLGIIGAVCVTVIAILVWAVCTRNDVVIYDVFLPMEGREKHLLSDAILRLQNELAASGAVCVERMPDGLVKVSLKVVKWRHE